MSSTRTTLPWMLVVAGLSALVALVWTTRADGQVVREEGTQSLARILDGEYDQFAFAIRHPSVLFVDLDADIYQVRGRLDAHTHDAEAAAEEEEGCEDDGGPGGFCLQVVDSDGEVVCFADRPIRPGWQRDARLACPFPDGTFGTFFLRVSARGEGENPCASTDYLSADGKPIEKRVYLLTASLRRAASEGLLVPALAQGFNEL